MEQTKSSGFGGIAIPPSRGYLVKQDLDRVLSYGQKLVSVFHQYTISAGKIPQGFEGVTNIFDASLATLTRVSSIFKDESNGQRYKDSDHPLNDDGLSYVAGLVLESARAWKEIESAIADSCLPVKEYRAKTKRDQKEAMKGIKKNNLDISNLQLDGKVLLKQLEHMRWSRAEDEVEDNVERLYEIQLCLLLVFQVVSVDALSKDL